MARPFLDHFVRASAHRSVQSGVYSYLERETDAAFKARMEAWCAAGGADSGEPEPKREDNRPAKSACTTC
jgi:hypothetical protein